jgi:hypothetical protein
MEKLFPLLFICLLYGCVNTKELNEQIYEVQQQELENSLYKSAKFAKVKIERQKRFRQNELPNTFKNRILAQPQADTVIVIEEYNDICLNCPASKMMVLHKDTIYTFHSDIVKGFKSKRTVHVEPYKTVSLDNEYLSNYHQLLVIKKKLANGTDWKVNPLSFGSDTCLGGDYTLATVIYPNGEVECMFVRCWWLGTSREYLKK